MKEYITIGLCIMVIILISGCSLIIEEKVNQTKWCLYNQTEDIEGCVFVPEDCNNPILVADNEIDCDAHIRVIAKVK